MSDDRHLDWDGCFNARDLGGLPTGDGRRTRWRAVVRSDTVDRLSANGWAALAGYGIRTIIDLRNDDERPAGGAPRPDGIATVHLPLDGVEDREFWDHWELRAPPLYYRPFLDRFPRRVAGALSAIARAPEGGVLVHCGIGRDRTGLITMLLLGLAGVAAEDIAADHGLSTDRLGPAYLAMGIEDDRAELVELLARENTTAREVIISTLASLEVAGYLREAGLSDEDLSALRTRLVGF